jgi:hypothetical protein
VDELFLARYGTASSSVSRIATHDQQVGRSRRAISEQGPGTITERSAAHGNDLPLADEGVELAGLTSKRNVNVVDGHGFHRTLS